MSERKIPKRIKHRNLISDFDQIVLGYLACLRWTNDSQSAPKGSHRFTRFGPDRLDNFFKCTSAVTRIPIPMSQAICRTSLCKERVQYDFVEPSSTLSWGYRLYTQYESTQLILIIPGQAIQGPLSLGDCHPCKKNQLGSRPRIFRFLLCGLVVRVQTSQLKARPLRTRSRAQRRRLLFPSRKLEIEDTRGLRPLEFELGLYRCVCVYIYIYIDIHIIIYIYIYIHISDKIAQLSATPYKREILLLLLRRRRRRVLLLLLLLLLIMGDARGRVKVVANPGLRGRESR